MTAAWSFERIELPLERSFAIARGTTDVAENVVVRVADDGDRGVGNAAPVARYGETPATVEAVLPDLFDAVRSVEDPANLQAVERALDTAARGHAAARAAVEVAAVDLAARRADLPVYRLWGLDPDAAPDTSITVGVADPGAVRDRAAAAVDAGFSTLKLKLGAGDGADRDRLAAAREAAPDAALRVDANEGWEPREAVRLCEAAAEFGVEFVEQPVSADDAAGLRRVHRASPVPVAVDESCRSAADVPRVADAADLVVVKLAKAGGLRAATRQVHAARAHGLDVMVGCMVESNASIAAAAHLAPMADYADLDGSLLLAADPYRGVPVDAVGIHLDDVDAPGTGARPRA